MSEKRRVLLIGVGLIGGSVALSIKKEHDVDIIGFDIKLENCQLAMKLNIIDDYTRNFSEEAEKADLIILACPVERAEQNIEILAGLSLKEHVIVTDVGSTKRRIMEKAELFSENEVTFIGGHPMAGSHKAGPGAARAHLFENAFYILTPVLGTDTEKVDELEHWLKGTKANFMIMDAEKHDHVTGVVSHFPHIIAASLVRQVESHATQHEHVNWLAAGGFRDITRIASSSPEMWRDIVKHNRPMLLTLLDEWQDEMGTVKHLLEEGNSDYLYDYFSGAKTYRDSLSSTCKRCDCCVLRFVCGCA